MTMWVLEHKKCKLLKHKYLTIFLTVFFLFAGIVPFSAIAQSKVWLDKDHNETTEKKGIYYRPFPKKKRNSYLIIDYYRNGNKYREGKASFVTPNKENFKGVVTYYYKDGKIAKKEKHKNGQVNGLYQEYYPSGELKVDGNYYDGKKEGVWKYYYKTGKIKTKGKYREDEKVGIWKTYYKNVYYPDEEEDE